MYQVIFHIKMALNYLKREKKLPEFKKELYIKNIEKLIEELQQLQHDFS